MNKEEKRCSCCDSDYEEEYYKYDDEIYCFDCLIEQLEKEGNMHINCVTHYYDADWGTLGTSDDINEVVQNICEHYNIEEVEGE